MVGSLQKHEWLKKKIFDKPKLVGLEEKLIKCKSMEYALLYDGEMLVVPDIYFRTKKQDLFYEVKSANNVRLYDKGQFQLERIYNHYQDNKVFYNLTPDLFLVMPPVKEDKIWVKNLNKLQIFRYGQAYNNGKAKY